MGNLKLLLNTAHGQALDLYMAQFLQDGKCPFNVALYSPLILSFRIKSQIPDIQLLEYSIPLPWCQKNQQNSAKTSDKKYPEFFLRGVKGRHLEVGAQQAPRLILVNIGRTAYPF